MLVQRVDQAQDVARGVLAVRVGGHDAGHVRPLEHRGVDAGLERAALAHVHRMHGDLGAQRAARVKDVRISLLAAVVHQQHVKAVLHDQLARQVDQAFVRLVGGDEHHGALFCCIRHMYSFYKVAGFAVRPHAERRS